MKIPMLFTRYILDFGKVPLAPPTANGETGEHGTGCCWEVFERTASTTPTPVGFMANENPSVKNRRAPMTKSSVNVGSQRSVEPKTQVNARKDQPLDLSGYRLKTPTYLMTDKRIS